MKKNYNKELVPVLEMFFKGVTESEHYELLKNVFKMKYEIFDENPKLINDMHLRFYLAINKIKDYNEKYNPDEKINATLLSELSETIVGTKIKANKLTGIREDLIALKLIKKESAAGKFVLNTSIDEFINQFMYSFEYNSEKISKCCESTRIYLKKMLELPAHQYVSRENCPLIKIFKYMAKNSRNKHIVVIEHDFEITSRFASYLQNDYDEDDDHAIHDHRTFGGIYESIVFGGGNNFNHFFKESKKTFSQIKEQIRLIPDIKVYKTDLYKDLLDDYPFPTTILIKTKINNENAKAIDFLRIYNYNNETVLGNVRIYTKQSDIKKRVALSDTTKKSSEFVYENNSSVKGDVFDRSTKSS